MPVSMNRERFSASLPFEAIRGATVGIVGVGNIGSHTAIALTQLGIPSLRLYDPDRVDDVNLAVQAYTNVHLGWDKVEALALILSDHNPAVDVRPFASAVDTRNLTSNKIMIACTDNIESRKLVYDWMAARGDTNVLLIDARMSFEQLEVYFVKVGYDGTLEKQYAETLTETDYVKAPCGQSSTNYTGRMAAAIIAAQARRHLVGEHIPYHVLMHLSSLQTVTTWRDGESYTKETFRGAPDVE